jgi:uncharacterized coiled-coil protein SlyX
MNVAGRGMLVCLLLVSAIAAGIAQTSAPAAPADGNAAQPEQKDQQLAQKIEAISAALAATQQQIEQSQRQMQQLQQELQDLRQQMAAGAASTSVPASVSPNATPSTSTSPAASATEATAAPIEERVQALEAEVKLHDQTKVESSSKYPVRLTGLILFNGFLNKGVPDNADLPAYAIRSTSTSGNGDLGMGVRQTILGIEGDGPRIAGARTSANADIDFFSTISYNSYGTAAGVVRMRTASIDMDWANNSVQVGIVPPLISPLSPASFATVAEPSLAGAGNLWAWAPQLRYTHRMPLNQEDRLQFEFGLWDSPSAGYNANQLFRISSPAELAVQPSYETRISYATAGDQGYAAAGDRGLQLGVSGYYSRQAYPGYQGYPGTLNLDSWAGTADWRIPIAHYFELSGEGYRGRSIGGLGGGVYKDAIIGTSPITGANVLRGLNAIGGWTQFKTRFSPLLESNMSIGMDDGFAVDFHAVVLSPTATATQLRARNKMVVGNLIFRPKTYLILSPEYRRIWTWPISGVASTVDVFTLSIGYQF